MVWYLGDKADHLLLRRSSEEHTAQHAFPKHGVGHSRELLFQGSCSGSLLGLRLFRHCASTTSVSSPCVCLSSGHIHMLWRKQHWKLNFGAFPSSPVFF